MKNSLRRFAKACLPAAIVRQKLSRRACGCVLLTFDDGPDPNVTPQVLDVLERWNAKAVFFVLGSRVAQEPQIVVDIVARGHLLGNHTYTHDFVPNLQNSVAELQRCQELVREITGQTPRYFRPPRGQLTPSILLAARSGGLSVMRWSLDVGEYSYLRDASAEQLAENLSARVEDRQIILLHDDNHKIPAALELALPHMVHRGFDLCQGVSDLA